MIDEAIRIIRIMLGNKTSVTRDEIEEKVNHVLIIPEFENCDKEQIVREIESIYKVRIESYRIIEKEERRLPWLKEKKATIKWNFWNRYMKYLQEEKNYAPSTLTELDRITDRILDGLFDPSGAIQIDKKGLVVGQVQSGKTSNYTGLICKAVDSGFKLILILAGTYNNLRSQTQLRLDEGFLGFDTQHTRTYDYNSRRIGVGKVDYNSIAHSLTSNLGNGDFTQGAANSSGFNFDTNEPIIAVIKKNPHVLRRLFQWLSAQASLDNDGTRVINTKALLIIDDESDHASINTNRPEWEATRINRQIRDIISLFRKSGYVGYTATPFANVFIPLEEDDLFPRDFILNISTPSNYIGPELVFGFSFYEEDELQDSVLPIVNRIDDYVTFVPDGHKQHDQLPVFIPDSLKTAIRCFILTCAIRRARGQVKVHNSMLIHVTRFQRWQTHITDLVNNQFDYYRMGIDQNDPEVLDLFRKTFEEDQQGYKSFVTITQNILNSQLSTIDPEIRIHLWETIVKHLNDAVSRIEVRAIHGGSREALDYYDHKDGLSVIAIGGNKLSRGLTLEGLSVSYYLRSSRMYDTLMQMGRWFGYRHGYVDLCRLFTSRELNEWFCHITHASEELREEFNIMSDDAGAAPEYYALKVRTHPGVLQISATNKLRTAVNVQISWSGRLTESYEFKKDNNIITNNFYNTISFISSFDNNYEKINNNFLWKNRSAEEVINFLNGIRTPENLKAYEPQNIIRFINAQLPEELTNWSIALMSKKNASYTTTFQIIDTPIEIGCYIRSQDNNKSDDYIYYLIKSHIISPPDEFIDLSESNYKLAMELTKEYRKKKNKEGEPSYPNGEIVRNQIRNPQNALLLIYLLDPTGAGLPLNSDPFVGYAISFPGSRKNALVSYAVNEQLLSYLNIDDNFNDFEDEDEN
ncbi:MAG: Z1 domain-containing protein [Spirochaetes bacterium]|nr:Z1 domain-containing protein [Spirochaetota bacterium]